MSSDHLPDGQSATRNTLEMQAPSSTTRDDSKPGNRLTLEQMAAVRQYMLKLVAIPGTLLAIISALTGYVIGQHEDAAVAQAVTQQTLPLITEAAKQTGLANGEAKSAAAQVNSILDEMRAKSAAFSSSIQQLNDSLKKSSDEAKANFSQVAKDLVANAEFRDALGKAYQSDLSSLKENLLKWGSQPSNAGISGPGGGSRNVASQCPEGSYMVGAITNSNTAPPYCLGCLVSVQAICRPLNIR